MVHLTGMKLMTIFCKDYVKAFLNDGNSKPNDEYQKPNDNTITIDEAAQAFVKKMFDRK